MISHQGKREHTFSNIQIHKISYHCHAKDGHQQTNTKERVPQIAQYNPEGVQITSQQNSAKKNLTYSTY
jgi:hypothetical protein